MKVPDSHCQSLLAAQLLRVPQASGGPSQFLVVLDPRAHEDRSTVGRWDGPAGGSSQFLVELAEAEGQGEHGDEEWTLIYEGAMRLSALNPRSSALGSRNTARVLHEE